MYKYILSAFLFLTALISGCKTNEGNIDNTLNSTNRSASVIESEDNYKPWWLQK